MAEPVFVRKPGTYAYKVWIDGEFRGTVSKVDNWVVRGTRITWEARSKNNLYKGQASTRIAAAQFLIKQEL